MHDGEIREASEHPARSGKEMITLVVIVRDADGVERELRDFLTVRLCARVGFVMFAKLWTRFPNSKTAASARRIFPAMPCASGLALRRSGAIPTAT